MSTSSFVDINSVKITTQYCISDEQRDQNMAYAISKIKKRIEPGEDRGDDSIAVVCFGPSLKSDWEKIKDFKYIITCSGAHKFLIDRNIIPTWHVDVDPRKHKVDLLGKPHPSVEYLLASVVHPQLIDTLQNYNVALWHGYQNNDLTDLPLSFPRGEWVFTGGCTVGLRALLLARFLGFKNINVFGMDCSYPDNNDGEHADFHPNPCKEKNKVTVLYQDVKYNTSLAMIEYARQFFMEISNLPDTKLAVHGVGLLQHLIWSGWRPPEGITVREKSIIALRAPELFSEDYLKQNILLHQQNSFYGTSGGKYVDEVLNLSKKLNTEDILDYGCGKGILAKSLPFQIKEYDPAISEKNKTPSSTDIVICTDVLEHIEPEFLDSVLGDLVRCTKKEAFFAIHTGPALKTLPDGRNAHLIQENKAWWWKKLNDHFIIDEMIQEGATIKAWLKNKEWAKTLIELDEESLAFHYIETEGVKFVSVNNKTKWRVETLRTKEPSTMNWLEEFQKQDIFVDIGANMGIYSLWAAKNKEVRTYAFEPESQNYALLTQNIFINNLSSLVSAFPLSLSDKIGVGNLSLTEFLPGSSCHQFDSTKNFKGEKTSFMFEQASFGVTLDFLVDNKMIPQPTHIKIDVDGLEPNIIFGAFKTLKNVKTLLVEVNKNLEEHIQMINILNALGFYYDENQAQEAIRKEGPFKGIGEYVFRR